MMHTFKTIAASAFLSIGILAANAQEGPAVVDPGEFVQKAGMAGLYEIAAGKLASTKAQDQRVRSFATQMVTDHTNADNELKATAGDMTLPVSIDPPHQKLLDSLQKASTTEFDRLYVDQQVSAHSEAVSLFTGFSTKGPNGALKGLAAKLLPTLQHHQEMVGNLKTSFQ